MGPDAAWRVGPPPSARLRLSLRDGGSPDELSPQARSVGVEELSADSRPAPMAMQAPELRLDRVRQLLLPKAGSPSPGTGGAGASVGTVSTVEDCWTAKAVRGNKARMSPIPG